VRSGAGRGPARRRRRRPRRTGTCTLVLSGIGLIALDDALLGAAGALDVAGLRSLDAIHVAAASELGEDLTCIVTYDRRMAAAAKALGLAVAQPT